MSRYTNARNYDQRDQRDQRDRRDGEHGRGGYRNGERYIPREREEDRSDHEPRRDVYYADYVDVYGEDVARNMYGEDNTPITHPSICIPRTFITIRGKPTKTAVFNTIRDLRIGHIERIDVVQKTDARGERYCTIYVHLQWNVRTELGRDTRKKLLDGNDVKIVYDDPWFWKCTMSTMEKSRQCQGIRATRSREEEPQQPHTKKNKNNTTSTSFATWTPTKNRTTTKWQQPRPE
jgi:hypothetical protein